MSPRAAQGRYAGPVRAGATCPMRSPAPSRKPAGPGLSSSAGRACITICSEHCPQIQSGPSLDPDRATYIRCARLLQSARPRPRDNEPPLLPGLHSPQHDRGAHTPGRGRSKRATASRWIPSPGRPSRGPAQQPCLDGREVCLSDAHPEWNFLSSCAGARGLALLTAENRVWAEYDA
jgi:hypothetical protein